MKGPVCFRLAVLVVLLPLAWVPFDWLQTFGDLRMTGDHAAHAMAAK